MTSGRQRPVRAGIWTVLWLVLAGMAVANAQHAPLEGRSLDSENLPPPDLVERLAPDGLLPGGGIGPFVEGSQAWGAVNAGTDASLSGPDWQGPGVIERVWSMPADSLDERVRLTRRASLERGVWNLDSAARAVLLDANSGLEGARAAVGLAPDLPAGRMALAGALWLEAGSIFSAVREAFGSLGAFRRHIEGALWMGGSLLFIFSVALMAGGLLAILVVAGFAAPHAAHDLGDLLPVQMPPFGRAALLGVLVLLAMLLGEGLLGLALGLFAIGVVYGTGRQRIMLTLAVGCIVVGAWPVARYTGAVLEGLPRDPVAESALAASRGFTLASDIVRLEAAGPDDLLAREALARLARRQGNLGASDAMYQKLIKDSPGDVVIMNNAANVRLHLGHMESALDLYQRALEIRESPIVLYNLAQAYGRAFQVDNLTATLARAQRLDGDLVADLTRLQGSQPEGFVVDLPLENSTVWRRVINLDAGERFASELRAFIAPGLLGRSAIMTAISFGVVLVGAWVIGNNLRASRWCARCGRRVCPRCDPKVSGGELCDPCNHLFFQPDQTDRELRWQRIEALKEREVRLNKIAVAMSVMVPGMAGVLSRRPVSTLVGALLFAVLAGAVIWSDGAVPDPLIAGAAGSFAFACLATLAGLFYTIVVATSLAARRNQ